MSEYIEIETEQSDDGAVMFFYSNLTLTDQEVEQYESRDALEEGSPLAQALAVVEGIAAMTIEGGDLTITRHPDAEWHMIVGDVTAVIKDFFL